MSNRLLTPEEQRHAFDRAEDRWKEDGRKDIWEFSTLWEYITDETRKAQDAKTHKVDCKEFGEWLESLYLPYVSYDDIKTFKQGKWPE